MEADRGHGRVMAVVAGLMQVVVQIYVMILIHYLRALQEEIVLLVEGKRD
ncbi:MAG: hypothetical protein LBG52_06220 [Candidatus Peribacteria bacterium]|nr:hypothetical protein [Candidatus Peribacteria bacterium]